MVPERPPLEIASAVNNVFIVGRTYTGCRNFTMGCRPTATPVRLPPKLPENSSGFPPTRDGRPQERVGLRSSFGVNPGSPSCNGAQGGLAAGDFHRCDVAGKGTVRTLLVVEAEEPVKVPERRPVQTKTALAQIGEPYDRTLTVIEWSVRFFPLSCVPGKRFGRPVRSKTYTVPPSIPGPTP